MSLKVFDLECASGHVFEGWFGSHVDYDSQVARGLLTCPVCDDHHIVKKLSAPHLNVANLRQPANAARHAGPSEEHHASSEDGSASRSLSTQSSERRLPTSEAAQVARLQAALLRQVRKVINSAENVGPRFAEEARRLHEEGDTRAIRGTATPDERAALVDDGIDVMTVPDIFDDERLQ